MSKRKSKPNKMMAWYGWLPDRPDHRDKLYAAIAAPPRRLPASTDLRPLCSAVENQGALGSCTANALAGALECHSGRLVHCTSPRKTNALFRALLDHLEWRYPHAQFTKVYVVVDHYGIHKAKAVARWLVAHPRFKLLFLPTYCPRANPLERAFGDVHDKCTRNHQCKRLEDLVWDVERHLSTNGPWPYHLSQLYYTPEVTAAVERISHEQQLPQAA